MSPLLVNLAGPRSRRAPTAALSRHLFDRFVQLRMFLSIPEIEPTNNEAERALRRAVIWRKLSFGTQSAGGSWLVETILTVVETCRQLSRSVIAFVGEAVQAHFA